MARSAALALAMAAALPKTSAQQAALRAPPSWANVAATPAMGFNSWNYFGCSVNETILMGAADAFVKYGLKDAGYEYINSDDCWLLPTRDADGNLVPDPAKFPSGINYTIQYIKSKGLKAGLYTARATQTCAKRMGACGHEAQDAAWYVAHGVQYLKDDACGSCGDDDWLTSYGKMQQGFWATGVPTYLSVEGDPGYPNMSMGGFGNSRRVGHDITSTWWSAVSLVDLGSGTYPFAHNASVSPTGNGGFWVDNDMLEIDNGQFNCSTPQGLVASQMHMALWCIMKAPLLTGANLFTVSPQAIAVLSNRDAIAVNQDPWGIMGRRVAVYPPKNASMLAPLNSQGVIAPCDAAQPLQRWRYLPGSNRSSPTQLYIVGCNASDPLQQWNFASAAGGNGAPSPLINVGTGLCIDAAGQYDPAMGYACTGAASQQWSLNSASSHIQSTSPAHCLDAWMMSGPDIELGSCKVPGQGDSNQMWAYNKTTRQIQSLSQEVEPAASCLALGSGPAGGALVTVDADGNEWCLNAGGSQGGFGATPGPCTPGLHTGPALFTLQQAGAPGPNGLTPYTVTATKALAWDNTLYGSGPLPHTRYITSSGGSPAWLLNASALSSGAGGQLIATGSAPIDDDLVGNVTTGTGEWCMQLGTAGMLEVWTAPLSGGRFAAVLFNRSPAPDAITLRWADLRVWPQNPAPDSASFTVRDIWQGVDVGSFSGSYTEAAVPAFGVTFLLLTPA